MTSPEPIAPPTREHGRQFPIQDGPSIPWSVIAPFEKQAIANHNQTLERLAQRGGLGAGEALCVLRCIRLFTTEADAIFAMAKRDIVLALNEYSLEARYNADVMSQMDAARVNAERERDRLQSSNAALRAEAANARTAAKEEFERVVALRMETREDGSAHMAMEFATEMTTMLAKCLLECLGDAPNYTEAKFAIHTESGDPITLVVQRHNGRTPRELRKEADAARLTAEQEREEARRERDAALAEVREYEEREAACCPEDVGFEEMIASQARWIRELEAGALTATARDEALKEAVAAIAAKFPFADNDEVKVGLGMAGNAVSTLRARDSVSGETTNG